jgi:DNA-binding transcriptional regulator YiaG
MTTTARRDLQPVAWTLGDRIAKVRHLMGLEQDEFAALFGKTQSAVAKWEADKTLPKDVVTFAQQLEELAAERGIAASATWVLGLKG